VTAPKLTEAQRVRLENLGEEKDVWNGTYPIWRAMRAAGLVEVVRSCGGFVRYRITDAGRAALKGGAR
jgi:hypothetical protein